ncbi:ABC transporter ATP-binding protein [Desulfobacula sp.]|uniref:ABC transporter ATP-binding protein n=1 Tax=Desulfobacula sp. TaxID=2593537 RepID=UPI00341A73DC
MFEIKNLKVQYGGAVIIKEMSMAVEEKQIVTLIGSNGAGKTTTLKAISGLKDLTAGKIFFRGERIDTLQPQEIVKRGLVQVPEGRGLFPYMTVMENLRLGAFIKKDQKKTDDMLEWVFDRFPKLKMRVAQIASTMSGGEQQMLAIACALMAEPKLLLLDEPSTGLSPLMVKEIGKVVRDINETGTAVLLVEQNAQLALSLAQKGYVMETGRIVQQGDASALLKSDYIKKAYLGK